MPIRIEPEPTIDRRRFLAAGAGAALALGLGVHPAAAAPKLGGVLRVGTNMPSTDTADPATASSQFLVPNLYDPPLRADPLFNLRPAGCSEWSPNRAATVWTFQVRRGAVFSNSRPLTSADYAHSIRRILDQATLSPYTTGLSPFLTPSGIHAPDRHTLRLELTRPNAFLDVLLSGQQFGAVPAGWTPKQKPLGSGPFTLEEFQPGTNAVLLANKHYWRTGHPYVDGIQMVALAMESARLQSLLGGAIDVADGLPTSGPALAAANVAAPVVLRGGSWAGIHFLGNEAPFTDTRVIQAIQLSLDRLELLETTSSFGHHFVTPDFEVVPPGDRFYPAGIAPRRHDPEKAQALLAQAGFADGLTFSVYCANGNVTNAIATTYQSIAKASNITVNIVPMPGTVFNSTIPGTQNIARSGQRQHVSTALGNNYYTGGSTNYTHYSNPTFDKLYLRLLATPNDQGAQIQLVTDMCELVDSTWAGAEAGVFDRVIGRSKRLQGLHDVRTVLDDVWLA
ncbi:MAG TPA: ABC transporter substrate-binding protein [Gaiellaceae bacterium]|nr:ABC transporter substrate-binding protein [Gaiellaceae bacterium]